MRSFALAFISLIGAACVDQMGPAPPMIPTLDITTSDPVIVAAGDVACGTSTPNNLPCKHAETAALVTNIAPAAAILAGDIQYPGGALSDFNTFYHPSWGVHKAITWPAPGNHDYQWPNAAGYFDYYNGVGVQTGRAGTRGQGYYSFNIGAWHIISLNSNCSLVSCATGSPQETWLRADLAANPAACTLAYWHHPRFSSGNHGNSVLVQPFWQALYDHGADLVIQGHDHIYERFGPQTPTGVADVTKGIRSFVVGTGGMQTKPLGTVKANSELRNTNSLGLLKLTLHPTSYDWQFVPIPGHTLNDAGSASCVTSSPPPPPPPPPPPGTTTLTIGPSADAFTYSGSPNNNFGAAQRLEIKGSPLLNSYLKFSVTGVGTKTILSAKLRLFNTNASVEGGRLHRVASTSWTETGITWANQPAYDPAVVGSSGPVANLSWYEIDVKAVITADGTYAFALESSSTDVAVYTSKEGTTVGNRPQLVIVVQ